MLLLTSPVASVMLLFYPIRNTQQGKRVEEIPLSVLYCKGQKLCWLICTLRHFAFPVVIISRAKCCPTVKHALSGHWKHRSNSLLPYRPLVRS